MKLIRIVLSTAVFAALPFGMTYGQVKTDNTSKGMGLRAGYGTNPDQFVIGVQGVLGKTLGFMRFAPSIDAGFGDDMTTFLFNADLRLLSFSPPGSPAGLYAGAGASIAVLDVSSNGSDTEVGLNVVTGLTIPMGRKNLYNLEVRIGVADMPDLRVLFGVMLGGRSKPSPQSIEIGR